MERTIWTSLRFKTEWEKFGKKLQQAIFQNIRKKSIKKINFLLPILIVVLISGMFVSGFYILQAVEVLRGVREYKKEYKAKENFQFLNNSLQFQTKTIQHGVKPQTNQTVIKQIDRQRNDKQMNNGINLQSNNVNVRNNDTGQVDIETKAKKMQVVSEKNLPSPPSIPPSWILPSQDVSFSGNSSGSVPYLKEKELLDNLLLNAEEARENKNYQEAIVFYQQYLEHREDPDVLNNLGGIYLQLGQLEKALHCFERALKLKPDPYYELNLAIALIKNGSKEKACAILKNRQFPASLEGKVRQLKRMCN